VFRLNICVSNEKGFLKKNCKKKIFQQRKYFQRNNPTKRVSNKKIPIKKL
jgi:hypothetical protein